MEVEHSGGLRWASRGRGAAWRRLETDAFAQDTGRKPVPRVTPKSSPFGALGLACVQLGLRSLDGFESAERGCAGRRVCQLVEADSGFHPAAAVGTAGHLDR